MDNPWQREEPNCAEGKYKYQFSITWTDGACVTISADSEDEAHDKISYYNGQTCIFAGEDPAPEGMEVSPNDSYPEIDDDYEVTATNDPKSMAYMEDLQ